MTIIISTQAAQHADTMTDADRALVREWTDFCRDSKLRRVAVYVDYDTIRDTSRWTCKDRARPFVVRDAYTLGILTSSKTLKGAMRLASCIAAERATRA